MHVIGIDIGTSGVKSTVFDDKANIINHAYREYDLISPGERMFEVNPVEIRKKAFEVIAQSVQGLNSKQVKAICITSFGESFVCFDEKENIIANSMIYMDFRGTEECEEIRKLFSGEELLKTTGAYIDPMFAMYKMRWITKNKPEIWEKTKRISFMTDFLAYSLGAEHMCDYSLATRSAMFDIVNKKWWKPGVDFSGISEDILPTPVPGGSVVGTVRADIANELGMDSTTQIILGGHDQILAAVGSGANEVGDIANGMGTVDCMTAIYQMEGLNFSKMLEYNLPIVPYLDNDNKFATYLFNMSGGCTIKWFRDTLAKDFVENAYDQLNKEAPKDPTGLIFIPYLAGGGTPYMDGNTPGVFAGLRLNTTRGQMFRGLMEGETYEMRLNCDCMQDVGLSRNRLITVGGGSKSSLWMQIRADILEQDIVVAKNSEAGTLGSAMISYTKLGLYGSLEEAQQHLVELSTIYKPNAKSVEIYRKNYEKYKKVYQTMKEIYR